MKTLHAVGTKVLLILAFLVGWLWLCFAFPEEITGFFESLGTFLLILLIALFVLGQVLVFIADMFPSKPPPTPTAANAPARQRKTLTPLIIGLALGWWLGGGPGDNGDGC